jgi:hypothetical protein
MRSSNSLRIQSSLTMNNILIKNIHAGISAFWRIKSLEIPFV